MKLITWNANSIRKRLDHFKILVEKYDPDIICLQETKVQDSQFPHAEIDSAGYSWRYIRGQKSYNGVAILSKSELSKVNGMSFAGVEDARHLQATTPDGIELHNFYVPAGGDDPDIKANPKFAFKMQYLDEMTDWAMTMAGSGRDSILVGDLNVAPLPEDVWDHKKLLKVITHTPLETETLDGLRRAGAWEDAMRLVTPAPTPLFTWWSYRARDWRAANKGRRLDHIWISAGLTRRLDSVRVLEDIRALATPSDHAPVLMVLHP